MTFDDLEFSISQYLDGTLPADQISALEARLKEDSAARQLLEEYRQLDAVLKQPAVPSLQWDRLAEHLSMTVAAEAERVEFHAVQYVDGTLASEEVVTFEAQLADDTRASDLVAQHRRLHGALKSLPRPDVRWDRLSEHLYLTATGEPRSYKISAYRFMRIAGGLAVAACVMIVTALGLRSHQTNKPTPLAQVEPHAAIALIQIGGLDDVRDSKSSRPAVAEVSFGAAAGQADAGGAEFADGIIVDNSPRSLIATNAPVAQDIQMPY